MATADTPPDITSTSLIDALATLRVNPDSGLSAADVEERRKEHGYNEVAEKKGHPGLRFLRKFWGMSAWMLELIMILSAVLRKYSDLAVVSGLLATASEVLFAGALASQEATARLTPAVR